MKTQKNNDCENADCFAAGTLIAIGNGEYKAVEDFKVGDEVWAAGLELEWETKTVRFSSSAGHERTSRLVLVYYGEQELIVTFDHVFMLGDKSLKTAQKLIPGDELMTPDGSSVPIKSISVGVFKGAVCNIATNSNTPTADLSGCFIVANGVVCGDYNLQMHAKE